MRILVVEDQDSIRKMIEALVGGRGHVVLSATSGPKALELARSTPPDAALLDVNLPPPFDGIELCARLRESSPTMPIIMITAQDDDETRARALAAGSTGFFAKPFSPLALLKEIDSIERSR